MIITKSFSSSVPAQLGSAQTRESRGTERCVWELLFCVLWSAARNALQCIPLVAGARNKLGHLEPFPSYPQVTRWDVSWEAHSWRCVSLRKAVPKAPRSHMGHCAEERRSQRPPPVCRPLCLGGAEMRGSSVLCRM